MRSTVLAVLIAMGCTSTGGDLTSDTLTRVVLEVDYQTDAEPYVGGAGPGAGDTWELFQVNADALYEGTGVTVSAPSSLSDMSEIGAATQEAYSSADLKALAAEHRDTEATGETAVIHALWIDGFLEDDGQANQGVIGVSLGGTNIIAMFKPVIASLGLIDLTRRFGEQTTLIHEFGHAVGLVNNGLPLTAEHHDSEHGAHCTNNRCVMYWANEGTAELAQFVGTVVTSGSEVIFDDDCLADMGAGFGS